MTITITTGNKGVANFLAYLDQFDVGFAASGRGMFSNGISGDYAGAEAEITATADPDAQAYILRGDIEYNMTTHTVAGTVRAVEFGYGATAGTGAGGAQDIALDRLDYKVAFAPGVADPASSDLIYGMLGSRGAGETDALAALLRTDALVFEGAAGNDVFRGYGADDMLSGKRGGDILASRGGSDTLEGGAGRDILQGGMGKDDFVFRGQFGRDRIKDFTAGRDDLDFSGLSGEAASFKAFKAASSEINGRVIYDMGDDGQNVIVLADITLDDLAGRDFIF